MIANRKDDSRALRINSYITLSTGVDHRNME